MSPSTVSQHHLTSGIPSDHPSAQPEGLMSNVAMHSSPAASDATRVTTAFLAVRRRSDRTSRSTYCFLKEATNRPAGLFCAKESKRHKGHKGHSAAGTVHRLARRVGRPGHRHWLAATRAS